MRRFQVLVLAVSTIAVALGGCGQATGGGGAATKPNVRVGSANFAESQLLAELYGQVLEANGYPVERKLNLGDREVYAPALDSGQIDLVPEYLATYAVFVSKDEKKASTDPAATQKNLQEVLRPKNLTVLDYAPAVDTNGFVVTKATADKYKLAKLSDLAAVSSQLVLGGPPECPTRPFCLQGLTDTYGAKFKDFKALDSGGPLTVAALEGNQVDIAVLFTTSSVIPAKNFVLLDDDKKWQLADNIAPVVRTDLLNKAPADFKTLINGVTKLVTTKEITDLNKKVELDKQDAKPVAGAWLKAKGLVK